MGFRSGDLGLGSAVGWVDRADHLHHQPDPDPDRADRRGLATPVTAAARARSSSRARSRAPWARRARRPRRLLARPSWSSTATSGCGGRTSPQARRLGPGASAGGRRRGARGAARRDDRLSGRRGRRRGARWQRDGARAGRSRSGRRARGCGGRCSASTTAASTSRSRNERTPAESLGWRPGARPSDAAMMGDVPDALGAHRGRHPPGGAAARRPRRRHRGVLGRRPRARRRAARSRYVGDADAGSRWRARSRGSRIAIDVAPTPLPFRAAGAFAVLRGRAPAACSWAPPPARSSASSGSCCTRTTSTRWRELTRLARRRAAGGRLRRHAVHRCRRVPRPGRRPSARRRRAGGLRHAARADRPTSLARVDAHGGAAARSGPSCSCTRSTRPARARAPATGSRRCARAPAAAPGPGRADLRRPARPQAVDIAMLSAQRFARGTPPAARASGRRAFIYNGILPRTGTADAGRRSARPDRERLDRGDDGDRALVLLGVDLLERRLPRRPRPGRSVRHRRELPQRRRRRIAGRRHPAVSRPPAGEVRGVVARHRRACFPRSASRRSGAASRTPG